MVLTFESVDEILWCDHSNESYWAVLSCGTVYYAVQGDSNYSLCEWNPMMWPFKWNFFISIFARCCFVFGIFQNEILIYCDDTKQWNVENELRTRPWARTLIERYNLKQSVLVLVNRDLILSCFSAIVKGQLNCYNCVWPDDLYGWDLKIYNLSSFVVLCEQMFLSCQT